MERLKLSYIQSNIHWEAKEQNLRHYEQLIQPLQGTTHLVVLPEMFTTGFSMNSQSLSEGYDGNTISEIKRWAEQYNLAVVGSFIASDGAHCYNSAFFVEPSGAVTFYHKRHLFRMGSEPQHFKAGKARVVVPYRGWNIALQVCYDLRFPVWTRNLHNQYDLLLYCANWPSSRIHAWDTLLAARAIENSAYVCGVNRIGTDATSLHYNGHSVVYDYRGRVLAASTEGDGVEAIETVTLDRDELERFRQKFPVWMDADEFTMNH